MTTTRLGIGGIAIGCIGVLLALPSAVSATACSDLCAPTANPCVMTVPITVTAGSTIDCGTRALTIDATMTVPANGSVALRSGPFTTTIRGSIQARGNATDGGGSVAVTASGACDIRGPIDTSGSPAGSVSLNCTEAVTVAALITSEALVRPRDGGSVTITGRTATISAAISTLGGAEAFGGTIDIITSGDIMVSARMDSSGGEGGDIALTTGANSGQGNITLAEGTVVDAAAIVAGGFAGNIDLVARGNGTSTGNVTVRGSVTASGRAGDINTGGGDGGIITITADGRIDNPTMTGSIAAEGGGPDGEGGEINLDAGAGGISLNARTSVRSVDIETSGGAVEILADGPIVINNDLDGAGGGFDGGTINVRSANREVTIGGASRVDASAISGGGFGGEVTIFAGGALTINGELRAQGIAGSEFTGDGGTIGLNAGAGATVTGQLRVDGGTDGGFGGDVTLIVQTGDVTVGGEIYADGNGGGGGKVTISAVNGSFTLGGELLARGTLAPGGIVSLDARTTLNINRPIRATGTGGGNGGMVRLATSNGSVNVNALVDSAAGASGVAGGVNVVDSCSATIANAGSLITGGPNSENLIIGRGQVTIPGRLRATRNTIRLNNTAPAPNLQGGSIEPGAVVVRDPSILACGVPTPTPTQRPPTPTRTRIPTLTPTTTPCDGPCPPTPTVTIPPSPTPTNTPASVCAGDCNRDMEVTVDELVRCVNIALGTTPVTQCPPGDVNNDGEVTVDELVRAVNRALIGCPVEGALILITTPTATPQLALGVSG